MRFQSPLYRGVRSFGITWEILDSTGYYCFNPLSIGAFDPSRPETLRERIRHLVSIPSLSGRSILPVLFAAQHERFCEFQSPLYRGVRSFQQKRAFALGYSAWFQSPLYRGVRSFDLNQRCHGHQYIQFQSPLYRGVRSFSPHQNRNTRKRLQRRFP